MPEESESEKIGTAINEAAKSIAQSDRAIANARRSIESNRESLRQSAARGMSGIGAEHHTPGQ